MTRYRTICIDPPWDYGRTFGSHGRHGLPQRAIPYKVLSPEAICALPVSDLAGVDARLFLWATTRHLETAFSVIAAWGFVYATTIVWRKTGNPSPFTGGIAAINAEFLVVAARGVPGVIGKWPASVVEAPKPPNEHSRKPDVFLDLVEQVSPGPYLEMFARRARFGWDYFGDESLGTADLSGAAV